MRIIATKPEENAILINLFDELTAKGVNCDVTRYEDGFGITVWSVDDLIEISETRNWPLEKKIRFMEYANRKIGGATEDGWEKLRTQVEQFIEDEEVS